MAVLQWNTLGTRIAETGVDRGVLYVEGSDGVPWNGLTRVVQDRPDADLTPIHFDGDVVNYKILRAPTSFELDTFSIPPEFWPCLGRVHLANGLYAENQPRQPFGFSYRSLVANDVDGSSYGYIIHIIFRAFAIEKTLTRKTIASSVQLSTRSYDIRPIPIPSEIRAPISHVSIKSYEQSAQDMAALEDILYGTASTSPTIPTLDWLFSTLS